ncbi:hypothetical protein AGMMS49982_24140 [Bacteroidia bacterium]|nr:hypothetical protein AGMMS49982_24140 [Bacteroidia bacterium]
MALINCLECGKQVSDKAKKCPQCGCPIRETVDDGQVPNSTIQIGLGYPKASLGKRFVASFLDGLIVVALFIPAMLYFVNVLHGSFYDISYFATHLARLFGSGEMFFFVILCLLPFEYALTKDRYYFSIIKMILEITGNRSKFTVTNYPIRA